MKSAFPKLTTSSAVILSFFLFGAAFADPIVPGVAIDNDNNEIASDDGWYDFYIPLSGSEDFDGELDADLCRNDGECGGTLNMQMFFNLITVGETLFTFDFSDLDVLGFGDSTNFYELLGLAVFDTEGNVLFELSADEIQTLLTGNSDSQQLTLSLHAEGPVYFHLMFGSGFNVADGHWYRNTLEAIRGQAVSVPEPGTLALLGLGMLGVGFASSRRRRAS